jgi:hypothetical protein
MKASTTPRRNLSSIRIIAPVPKFGIQMPLAVSPLSTSFFGAKVDGISSMQAHPFDPYRIHKNPEGGSVQSSATPARARRFKRKPAFTAEETRHNFAIEALEKPGAFRPQPYLYTCVRCRWIFRLNDTRGSIIALDGLGRHLPEPENAKRIVTFHRGPCPAFTVFEYLVPEIEHESRFSRYLSKIIDVLRGLTNSGRPGTPTHRQETTSA